MQNQNGKAETEIDKHLRVLNDKIGKYISEKTPPDVLIIKAHLICEYYLNQLLILKEICESTQLPDMTFYNKLEKALDKNVAIEKHSYKEINKLNKLRNKVGHELEYKLSESDVDELGMVRGKEYILEKYDFENLDSLLNNNLKTIIINLSFIVFKLADTLKLKASEYKKDQAHAS